MKISCGHEERRVFVARLGMLAEATAFIEAFCARNGIDDRHVLRLQLIVEELFTNTVSHGYGHECDEPIELALSASTGRVSIIYQDAAHAYDPLATLQASRVQLDAAPEDRPVGHLGVHIVAGLVDDARYARSGGRNELRLSMRVAE